MTTFIPDLEDRFLRYVQIDTESDESSATTPSTMKQYDLLNMLAEELREIGAQDVAVTDYATVIGTIPATMAESCPTIAFFAHVDTAPAFSGTAVKPIVHRNYQGQTITLPDDPSQKLDPTVITALAGKMGEDIITASGTTLLGADDKAGVAVIMSMTKHLLANPDIPHGEIRVCFTPDEEIGRGVVPQLVKDANATAGYTLDGGTAGEAESETFSADKALVTITGVSAHPGTAKGVMVNALHLAAKFADALPQETRTPETTEGREGFIHLYEMKGSAAFAELHFILRDFEMAELEEHGGIIYQTAEKIRALEPRAQVEVMITPQYRNMRYWLDDDKRPISLAYQAIEQLGLTPITTPIRGGTDGSRLTEMGLPTPNLFTGMQNIHGPLEWISLQDMEKSVQMCLNLVGLWAKEEG
ncbi:MAG: peptidase T [Chloroflexota bacterium]